MLRERLLDLMSDEEGITAIEYGLIGSIVCTAIVLSLPLIGFRLSAMFQVVANGFR